MFFELKRLLLPFRHGFASETEAANLEQHLAALRWKNRHRCDPSPCGHRRPGDEVVAIQEGRVAARPIPLGQAALAAPDPAGC